MLNGPCLPRTGHRGVEPCDGAHTIRKTVEVRIDVNAAQETSSNKSASVEGSNGEHRATPWV